MLASIVIIALRPESAAKAVPAEANNNKAAGDKVKSVVRMYLFL
ncbi:hypothetical protein yfred0001_13000 [Yersinia frederiksenii ATCC 33641]|nr:hypothetical protein yfred0001_13000 [Yersinia frederiksenii ATCC 33641]